jgi:DNA repair exonuclease SbcCD nuclease subunit
VKIVHTADIHLDSPLRGLVRYEGAPADRIRGATRRALENLVALCEQEQAALLLIAGDLFDGDWRDYSTGLFFVAQMARLRSAGTQVVMLRGNHDAESQIARSLRLPDNVRELATRKAETVLFEELGVAVHGRGFPTRKVVDDIAAHYPSPLPGLLNVGLLHTSLNGRPGHEPYAPTTLDVLRGKGYDYWALGHVHAREVVSQDPWVVFPGNLQGRHARELGEKGATVITVENGRVRELRHEVLDTVRWATCAVDVSAAADGHEAVELVHAALGRHAAQAGGRLLAARVALTGQSHAHAEIAGNPERFGMQLRAVALDVSGGEVWLEKTLIETRSELDAQAIAARSDALGQLAGALSAMLDDRDALLELPAVLEDLRKKLPRDAFEGPDGVPFDDPAFMRGLANEVRELLLSRLLGGERP